MLRRLITRWLPVVALAAIATTAALPTTASAAERLIACPAIAYVNPNDWPTDECGKPIPPAGYRTAGLDHKGWTYLNLNYCAPGMMCALMAQINTSAWRWTGRAWTQTTLNGGWVYVYPYTGHWRWAWTQDSGWVAISGHRFELR